ncbi:MAG: NAD(P)/FAD-dependent oxidoreductase [Patulibacter sp.]
MTHSTAVPSSSPAPEQTVAPDHEVVVIGAGPGGIAVAVLLQRAGIDDFVLLERADDVGGSWRDNRYPGISVDIPSIAYQYSFARNPRWSRIFAKGAEVQAYHRDVAERFGVIEHVRFGAEVVRETWDASRSCWQLTLSDGDEVTARFVITAVGAFLRAKADPGIPGVEDFAGTIQRPDTWDADVDLRGKRVAIVGTGASAVQIVPSIAPEVARLDVFQRTPVWCLPKPDAAVPKAVQRALAIPGVAAGLHAVGLLAIEAVTRFLVSTPPTLARPILRGFDRVARAGFRAYLRRVVRDPETAAALQPDFGPLTKRPTLSNTYLRAFNRPNVALHTTAIERITPRGVRTVDGTEHEVDVLVLATGYELFSDPESYAPGAVVGRDGFDLGAFYARQGLQAYESVSLPGLPNRWMIVGPYSWTGTGWHALVELAAAHAVRAITTARQRAATTVEVRPGAHAAYHRRVVRRGRNLNYYFRELNGGVRTYYVNSQGDVPYIRPSTVLEARWSSRNYPLDDYAFSGSAAARTPTDLPNLPDPLPRTP